MATQTVTTSGDIPKVLEPYYVGTAGAPGLIPAAQQFYSRPYEQVYGAGLSQSGLAGAGRIAEMSPFQTQVGKELSQMQVPGQFGMGTQYGAGAGNVFTGLSGLQALGVEAPLLTQYQMQGPQSFTGSGIMQQYMSPYQQAVTDIQKSTAITDAQKAQLAQNLAAPRQGTYGGARQLLATTEREKALAGQLGNIQATGLQSAYAQGLQQFNTEQAARQQAAQANLQAALQTQQLGAGQSLAAQQANQQAALQAAQQRLSAGQGLAGLASTMGQLGVAQQAADLDRIKTMGAFGDLQRGIQQQRLDTQYQDLMREMQYPEMQISGMSNVLRGIPTTDQTQQVTTPAPSFASQLSGLGLAGLGLYNMFGK
jgi:hypothetical protein